MEQEIINGAVGKRQAFQMSKETSDLIAKLETAKVGETITYDTLSAVACGDVRGRCKGNLDVARRHLENEKRVLFGCVRNVGIKRATDIEVVSESERGLLKIRRTARRAAKKTVCVQDFNALPEEMRIRHNAALSIFGAIDLATRPSKVKQVQEAVKSSNDRLAVGQTLELFGK